ncbi:hypothetical protein BGX27_004348 [Mortierella sp. AM989]|nr:hypothetical protein BGX27_004348 [Mortierella sp. AM989]
MDKFAVPLSSEPVQVRVENGIRLSKNDECELMIQWLEVKNNFEAVYGRQKTKAGPRQEFAKGAWSRAAQYLSASVGPSLTPGSVMGRFRRYKDSYFEATRLSNASGKGVPDSNSTENFDDLLNQTCYGYERMKTFFGKSPHLQPAYEATTWKGQVTFNSRAKNYTVHRIGSLDSSMGNDDDETDSDWCQVTGMERGKKGGEGEEGERGEGEEEEGEG